MENPFGIFDDHYSFEELFEKLKVINGLNSKTIAFADLCDYQFNFFEPAKESDIARLKEAFEYDIPEEYLDFLRLTNGLDLNSDSRLSIIHNIIYEHNVYDYPNNIMIIGHLQGETQILIDLASKDNLYMYVTEPIGYDKAYSLNCDFIQFLIRYIMSYGAHFWTWGADWNKTISTEGGNDPDSPDHIAGAVRAIFAFEENS